MVAMTTHPVHSHLPAKNITLEDVITKRTFAAKSISSITTSKNGEFYTTLDKGSIIRYRYQTGTVVDTLVHAKDLEAYDLRINNYEFSPDETKILFYVNAQSIYRRSYVADNYVWDISGKNLLKVSPEGMEQLATFSPDGQKVAFVKNNNLYVSDLKGNIIAITTDGEKNRIINGAPDWVYEEEFSFNKAFEWSPDGKKIAWIRFDESRVKEYNLMVYKGLKPERIENTLYPSLYSYKYPKAGEDNSIVSVLVYNLENQETTTMDIGLDTDIYIPRIYWSKQPDILAIARLNRHQNKFELLFAQTSTGKSKIVYTDTNPYYIDESAYSELTFIDPQQILLFSERDGYNHLYLYNTSNSKLVQITKGNYDVINLYGYAPKTKTVYYSSTEEGSIYRTLFSIKIDGKNKLKLSENKGTNSAVFNADFSYFINTYSSATQPPVYSLYTTDRKLIRIIEDNSELVEKIKQYKIPKKNFTTVTTSENIALNAWILKPTDFDSTVQYPAIITQYSGPNSQQVLDRWGIGWEEVLAQEGFIVLCVDPRGTGGRGESFRKVTYLQLGKYETIDLIETAQYLQSLPYISAQNIGIWGWSYGGFMALNCITQGADVFAAAVSVAPVTNWRYYDNIYTERYMRKPQENADGYDNNSPINHVEKFKGNLLLITGSFDDNVHPQNSYEFAETMVQADKQFDMMVYTNRNHSIFGGNTRLHLYKKKIEFFKQNLNR